MSKGKLQKFAEMETFKNVFQYPFSVISDTPFDMKGTGESNISTMITPLFLNWAVERVSIP